MIRGSEYLKLNICTSKIIVSKENMSDELSLYPMTVNTCFFLIYRGSIDKKANITEWAKSMNECECATHKTKNQVILKS